MIIKSNKNQIKTSQVQILKLNLKDNQHLIRININNIYKSNILPPLNLAEQLSEMWAIAGSECQGLLADAKIMGQIIYHCSRIDRLYDFALDEIGYTILLQIGSNRTDKLGQQLDQNNNRD